MTHSSDEYTPSSPNAPVEEPPQAANDAPVNATHVTAAPLIAAVQRFEKEAEDSFRIGTSGNLEDLRGFYEAGSEACETFAHALRASFEEVAAGIGQLNAKLMEFGRVNTQSNLEFVTNVAGVRSMHDAVDMQSGYVREQYDAASAQLRELQALAADIAEKAASPFQQQFARYTQMLRSC